MKKILTLLLFYFCTLLPSLTEAAITRGVGPLYISLAAVTSNSGTLNGTTAHRSLVLVVLWYDPAGTLTPTITISGESNATPIAGSKFTNYAGINNGSGQIFYLADIQAGGNKTITATFSTATYSSIAVFEYVGMDLASQPDASVGTTGASSTPTTSLTTTTANALIVAGVIVNGADATAGSGYALFGGAGMPNNIIFEEVEDQLDMGSTGSKTVNFIQGSTTAWGITAASFKASSGGGGSTVIGGRMIVP